MWNMQQMTAAFPYENQSLNTDTDRLWDQPNILGLNMFFESYVKYICNLF